MQNNIKSNWLGSKKSAPVLYRNASKGNVFTRTEKLAQIFAERAKNQRKSARQELILQERNKAKQEKESRENFFQGIRVLSVHSDAKIRHGKDSLYIQPRLNGSFGKKIAL